MISRLLTVLAALAELLGRLRRQKEQETHQHAANEIKKNPGIWFDQHFNGRVFDPAEPANPAELPKHASTADQADAAKSGDQR